MISQIQQLVHNRLLGSMHIFFLSAATCGETLNTMLRKIMTQLTQSHKKKFQCINKDSQQPNSDVLCGVRSFTMPYRFSPMDSYYCVIENESACWHHYFLWKSQRLTQVIVLLKTFQEGNSVKDQNKNVIALPA